MESIEIPAELNITHYGNDAFIRTIEATEDGEDVDFTGYTGLMQIKSSKTSGLTVLAISVTFSGNAIILSQTSANMATMAAGEYYYDLKLTVDGAVTAFLFGSFTKLQDVSR